MKGNFDIKRKHRIIPMLFALALLLNVRNAWAGTETEDDISIHTISTYKMSDTEIKEHFEERKDGNIGVSSIAPVQEDGLVSYGQNIPKTQWDLSSGKYDFSGTATTVDLYTNYYFTGRTKYIAEIKNYSDEELTVKAKYGTILTKETINIKPGYTW